MLRYRDASSIEVDGVLHTYSTLLEEAKRRGVNLSKQAIRARYSSGRKTMDELLAPVSKVGRMLAEARSAKKSERKSEMQEILATLGPPRRF